MRDDESRPPSPVRLDALDEQAFFVRCEGCRERVDPDDDDVLRAFTMIPTQAFTTGTEWMEGPPVAFHCGCFPTGSPRFKLTLKP